MLTRFALAAALAAGTLVYAAPFAPSSKHATHRRRELASGVTIEAYQPPSTFETFGEGVTHPLHKREDASPSAAAAAFIESRLGVQPSEVSVKKAWTGSANVAHVYAKQLINSIPVANAVANVAFNSEDRVVAFGQSFVKPTSVAPTDAKISEQDAISAAEKVLGGTKVDHPVSLEYVITPSEAAVLAYVVQVETDPSAEEYHWYEGFIDAATGDLVSVTDFTTRATYRVIPIQNQDPTTGFSDITDPQDGTASPQGWHSDNGGTVTAGNNVIAAKAGATTPESAPGAYLYDQDPTQQPTVAANVAAGTVNAFYVGNSIHDWAYRYGFTENSFNFQNDNFGKGGAANDRVTISVQDSAGTNNADFSTPADGQSGRMRMFRWTLTSPNRDGDLENDIIVHEYTHGITNRLTGGGTGRCLQSLEAGGMGEGWSDANAEWSETKSDTVTDFTLGSYVFTKGIRTFPYSTSSTTNPLTYASIGSLFEVHRIGEVWANILHQVYAALVAQYGWSPVAKSNPDGAEGNIVYFHLFIDQLALQPCNPTVLNARDAWIQADTNRYGGANRCLLWKAFASRGLGTEARAYVDSATVPADCA